MTRTATRAALAAACSALITGCSAGLFDTPSEIRGVWRTDSAGRVLDIRQRSLAVYQDDGLRCDLLMREDFVGPRLADWETALAPDRDMFRFREPGSRRIITATRLPALPDRCAFATRGSGRAEKA